MLTADHCYTCLTSASYFSEYLFYLHQEAYPDKSSSGISSSRISSSAFLCPQIFVSAFLGMRSSSYAQLFVLHFFVSAKIHLCSYSYRKYSSAQIFVRKSLSANLHPQIFVRISSAKYLGMKKCGRTFVDEEMRRFADKDLRTKKCR